MPEHPGELVIIRIPTPLRSYTNGADQVAVQAVTVGDAITALGDADPGILERVVAPDGSSAYLGILTRDERAKGLDAELRAAVLVSSVVFVLEVQRNLVRLARENFLTTEDYLLCGDRLRHDIEGFCLRDVTIDLCLPSLMPAAMLPRSLDLLHLRTAMLFHSQEPLTRFVSLDRNQNQAARELGLPV